MASKPNDGATMLTRRNALKVGAGAGAAALGLSGAGVPDEMAMTQEAKAIPPVIIYGAGVAGAATTTWALHELGVWGTDAPPDGLTADALSQEVQESGLRAESTLASTVTDNSNMVGFMPETLFSEGKLAALEKIENGATKTEATTAGQKAAKSQMVTIEKNHIKSWNGTANQLLADMTAVLDHPNLSISGYYMFGQNSTDEWDPGAGNTADGETRETETLTLRDGSTKSVVQHRTVGPTWHDPYIGTKWDCKIGDGDGNFVARIPMNKMWDQWSNMQTEFDNILSNISLWVDNTYDQIQTGEITSDEYLSGVDLANTIAEENGRALAIADMIAMNIPGDFDHESTIQLENDDAKLAGFLAYNGSDSTPTLDAGTTIDPSNFSGEWYIAFRPGSYIESWTAYDDTYGIQGGEVHFTSDPTTSDDGFDLSGKVAYAIDTTHDETATVAPSDFTKTTDDNSNTVWAVDLSDQLEQTITDIAQVRQVYDGDSPDTYTSKVLNQPATILEIEGTDTLDIQEHREPQDDTNYISDSEWQDIIDQQEELIDRFEEASSSAGGGWSPSFDVPTWGPLDSIEDWGVATIGAVVGSMILGNLGS